MKITVYSFVIELIQFCRHWTIKIKVVFLSKESRNQLILVLWTCLFHIWRHQISTWSKYLCILLCWQFSCTYNSCTYNGI